MICGAIYSQSDKYSSEPLDIYDRISNLKDSITNWNKNGYSQKNNSVLLKVENIDALLQPYSYTINNVNDDSFVIEIQKPKFKYLSTNNLQILLQKFDTSDFYKTKSMSIIKTSNYYLLDSLEDTNTSQLSTQDVELLVLSRLALYNALSLNELFWREHLNDLNSSSLIIHGHNIDTIFYKNPINLFYALHKMNNGLDCYIDPTVVKFDTSPVELSYLMITTKEDALGHHMYEIKESYDITSKRSLELNEIIIHFYPYVRTDNIEALFGKNRKSIDSLIQYPIRR